MWRGVIHCAEYLYSVLKVSFLISLAFFLPKLWICHIHKSYGKHSLNHHNLILGLEKIEDLHTRKLFFRSDATPYKIALITNQTGKDQYGNRNIDLLVSQGIKPLYVLVPKHGYHANQPQQQGDFLSDAATHIPIINWDKAQQMENLINSIDILLFDMQDSGLRYGHLSTLFQVLRKASDFNKKVIILDRPNVLGCYMEGSFSLSNNGGLPIPLRHGMTLGELASYYNKNLLKKPADLVVIAMENYNRQVMQYSALLCDNLSPNIRSLESCYGYSFLGLFGEISPFDVGLGTDKSFQCLALPESIRFPKQTWYEVRTLLKSHGIDSRYHRYYSKRKKRFYSGLTIGIANINQVSSFNTFLDLLDFFNKKGIKLTLSATFDTALGTQRVRQFIEGKIGRSQLQVDVNNQLRTFYHHASSSFLYSPLPRVVYS